MKLAESNINVEQHGVTLEQEFSIGDLGLVLEILRSKLYADPISAICREYACNARDAHRESGRPEVPIKIVLPSNLDANFRVIDQGTGITPDRMANVFIKFASSTKRNSNEFTGGFGLGSKTGFAYGDSFSIISTTEGIKRTYAAFIDKTKIGKLSLLHEVPTDARNGTEIVIPVKPGHFNEFSLKTEIATRWWDVRPEIVGAFTSFAAPDSEIVMRGQGWKIYRPQGDYYQRSNRTPVILVDGIAYAFDQNIIYKGQEEGSNLSILFTGAKQLVVDFPNGLLSLAANRENIHWDDQTTKHVVSRLGEIADEIRANLDSEVNKANDYIEACEIARKLTKAFEISKGFEGYFKWRGHDVKTLISRKNGGAYQQLSIAHRDTFTGKVPSDAKITRTKGSHWEFGWTDMIVLNDVGIVTLSPQRVIGIINMLPHTYKAMTIVDENFLDHDYVENVKSFIPWIRLSDFMTKKDGKKGTGIRKASRIVYRRSLDNFSRVSAEVFESDKKVKVYVPLNRGYDNKPIPNVPGLGYDTNNVLSYLQRSCNVSIYGFEGQQLDADPESFEEFTDEAISIRDYIETVVLRDVDIDSLRAVACGWERLNERKGGFLDPLVSKTLYRLSNKVNESLTAQKFNEYTTMYDNLVKMNEQWKTLRSFVGLIYADKLSKAVDSSPEYAKLSTDYVDLIQKYPLLKHYWKDPDYMPDGFVVDLAEYINLKDTASP